MNLLSGFGKTTKKLQAHPLVQEALFYASLAEQEFRIAETLLAAQPVGQIITWSDRHGNNVLHALATRKCVSPVQPLLSRLFDDQAITPAARANFLNATNSFGQTPWYLIAKYANDADNLMFAQKARTLGADINQGSALYSVLVPLLERQLPLTLDFVLRYAAPNLSARNGQGDTPPMVLIRQSPTWANEHLGYEIDNLAFEMLLRNPVDWNLTDRNGNSLLHLAALYFRSGVADTFVSNAPKESLLALDRSNRTFLDLAREKGILGWAAQAEEYVTAKVLPQVTDPVEHRSA